MTVLMICFIILKKEKKKLFVFYIFNVDKTEKNTVKALMWSWI